MLLQLLLLLQALMGLIFHTSLLLSISLSSPFLPPSLSKIGDTITTDSSYSSYLSLSLVDTFRPLILQPHQHDLFHRFTSIALTHCFLKQHPGASQAVPTVYLVQTSFFSTPDSVLFCARNRGREIASRTSVEIFSCVIKCSLKHKTRACGNMHKFASKTTHIFSPTLTH